MARLPTVGGDTGTWGTVLNDYLTESASRATLDSSPSVGATSFTVALVPTALKVGSIIAIDAFTTECELRSVAGISSLTITVDTALKFAHASGDAVNVVHEAVPVTWYGLTGDATDEWGPVQRLFREATLYGGLSIVGTGTYYIQQPLFIPTGNRIERFTLQSRTGFAPVDANGAMVMLGNDDEFFTAVASTDVFTTTNAHGAAVNDAVAFNAPYGETLPAGVTAGRVYYIKTTPTGSSFTVSETIGGATLNLTADGAGWCLIQIGTLARVFWESLRVNLLIANLNGINLGLQQPSWTRNLRIEMDVAATATTASGVNALDSVTVNVASTTGFPTSGTFSMEHVTTKLRSTVTYTGTTATSFTGCGAHPATTGGEVITMGTTGLILGGQLSYHDNVEINTSAKCTGVTIAGSGHKIRGLNGNGVNDGDTGAAVLGGTRNISIDDIWTEQMGRAGVEITGVSRGFSQGGYWLVSSASPTTAPVLLVTASTTSYVLNQMRVTSTGQLLVNDTARNWSLLAWDGGTPGQGETDNGLVMGGMRQSYDSTAPLMHDRILRGISAAYTVRRIDEIVRVDTTAGNVTITLPPALSWFGDWVTIVNYAGANNVIIDPTSTETIDGATTISLAPNESATVFSSSSGTWHSYSRGRLPGTLQTYTPTNVTTDRSYDADTVVIAELADIVGTLIADLQAKKIIA